MSHKFQIMDTKAIYLIVILTFFTKIYAQNKPNAIEDLNFRSSEYVELSQSQEIVFEKYLVQLNKDKVYRTVTVETCTEYKNGILNYDEENSEYPLQVVFKKTINFNDNFVIKFDLDNCVGGSMYYRDFAFFTKTANNEIIYNKTLTNDLKNKFHQFVISKFNEGDRLCHSNEYNYIFTDGLNITKVNDNIVYGKYVLYGLNAPNCCPEFNGEFEYNIITKKIQFKNEKHKSVFTENETKNDSIQILDWTPPFEEKIKIESEPVAFKNSNIKLTNEQKEALKQFIAICNINVNIEDTWKPEKTLLIINWLEIEENVVIKEKIKNQLDKVLYDEDLRFTFLNNISKMSGINDDYTYLFIKSFNVPNIVSMKSKDVEVLSKLINNNYKYIRETSIQSNSDNQNENTILYKAVDKKAIFKGGEQNYIYQKLIYPEIENLDNRISEFIVNASVQILEDGSIGNFSFKSDIRFKTEYTFDSELKSELINKYSQYFEDAIASVLVIMPKWIPAKSEEQNIKSRVNIPVKFKISE